MALTYSALEDLTASISQYVPNCPPNQMKLQLSRAVRDFFARTEVWKESVELNISNGTTTYALPFADDVYVGDLDTALIDDYDVMHRLELTGDDEVTVDADFDVEYDGFIVDIKAVVVPWGLPCDIPARMVNRYSDFLIAGAVMNICGIPNKAYTNKELKYEMKDVWDKGITRASTDAVTGNKKQSTRWRG